MKIVFLDIDGVMNNWTHLDSLGSFGVHYKWDESCFDPKSVKALSAILRKSGAKVVISSTWRKYDSDKAIEAMLEMHGLRCEVIDHTPVKLSLHARGDEIAHWLMDHPEVTHFIAIDDDPAAGENSVTKDHWIQTDEFEGLQLKHVDAALKLLGVVDE